MQTMIVSSGELEKKSTKELVEIYNSLSPPKPVKKFKTHATGVRRVLAQIVYLKGQERKAVAEEAARNAPPPPKPRPQGGSYRLPFTGPIKPPRIGTKRERLVELLTAGITFQGVRDEFGWTRKMAYETIRFLHSQHGYGLTQDNEGTIRLIKEAL